MKLHVRFAFPMCFFLHVKRQEGLQVKVGKSGLPDDPLPVAFLCGRRLPNVVFYGEGGVGGI